MIFQALDEFDGSAASKKFVEEALQQWRPPARQPQARSRVARLEAQVAANPRQAFDFDARGWATLADGEHKLQAGHFSCPSLAQLLGSLEPEPNGPASRARLMVLDGQHPVSDIGALQALAPPDSLFQVASQFNCLEAPGPQLVPVQHYFSDPTQGPRASISAFAGTLLRHYTAGELGFVQGERQVNLLHRLTSEVVGGYLLSHHISNPQALARSLEERFWDIEVGLQRGVEVSYGANWDGTVEGRPLISQVFTSTLAGGAYSTLDLNRSEWFLIVRQLLRAAYLGTLLAAIHHRQRRVVLTLIGGGVFSNPMELIWDSILWAFDQAQIRLQRDLTVIVNGRNLGLALPAEQLRQAAQERGGDLLALKASLHFC